VTDPMIRCLPSRTYSFLSDILPPCFSTVYESVLCCLQPRFSAGNCAGEPSIGICPFHAGGRPRPQKSSQRYTPVTTRQRQDSLVPNQQLGAGEA
jgi:hypothetical protein